jgi:hypothetical protein
MRIIPIVSLTAVLALGANLQAQTAPQAGTTVSTQGFSVVLLLGEPQGSIPSEGLSTPAKKALADIKEFLPYKGYRVLDTQWVAGSDFGDSQGKIHGVNDQEYVFTIATTPKRPSAPPGTPEAALARAHFQLGVPTPGPFAPVLDNSFNIRVGETVVVGTSGLQSDKALVVLVTAVPAGNRTGR